MAESLVQQAASAFNKGNYIDALSIYRQIADQIGDKNFSANMQLCIKRMGLFLDDNESNKSYLLSHLHDESLILHQVALAINIPTATVKTIDIFGFSTYSNVKDKKHPRALASIQYFDKNCQRLLGEFKGLAKSEKYGGFHYINDTNGEHCKLFTLHPPEAAIYARIEFHPFSLKSGESITISNKIDCQFTRQSHPARTSNSPNVDLSILGWPLLEDTGQIRMMSIFDEFSRECFAPHANLIEPRPDSAIPLLKRDKPELLFVESTWRGNKSTWQYRVAQYAHPPGTELFNLVDECKKIGVPTIFWNKEDPVHFDNFINAAEKFDYIFTTAEEAIPRYQARCKAKVHALPFAAEVNLHNPIGSEQRNKRVCFAGSYYANRFKERRDDQLMLLDAASTFNLDIFDRNAGAVSRDFSFPERFDSFIRGKLPYTGMIKAYRQYRVFLNVNSVIDSTTMFSRRVFELLACGTPIVSTVSTGIDQMFGKELVWTVRDREEAEEAIRHLMQDDKEWRRRSLKGIRKVFAEHTFAHRFDRVLRTTGIREGILPERRVLLVGEVSNQAEADALIAMQARQVLVRSKTHILLISSNDKVQINTDAVKTINQSDELLPLLLRESKDWRATHLALLDAKALYGKFYVQDTLNALLYSHSPLTGKPRNGIDTYSYSRAIATGSYLLTSDYLNNLSTGANRIRDFEEAILTKLRDEHVFLPDAANFLSSANASSSLDTSNALRRIEI